MLSHEAKAVKYHSLVQKRRQGEERTVSVRLSVEVR